MECRNLRLISGSLLIDRPSARREIALDFPEEGLVIRVSPGEGEGSNGTARGCHLGTNQALWPVRVYGEGGRAGLPSVARQSAGGM